MSDENPYVRKLEEHNPYGGSTTLFETCVTLAVLVGVVWLIVSLL